ncbi:hypothetical protein [Thalassospira aquimaris]|uniref:Uncharacterized protein n=1 Tax=Thalassospira aquimaris TaxID=3037796 RepID=A0ABT6GHQ0_9PROT|nr:hypothetical protein [Thalassospira sp. FZY0004]MDG4721600.1 hypothetical protein [Thalassospira sp. FZY0004]
MATAIQATAIFAGSVAVAVFAGIVVFIVWLDVSEFDPAEPWN